MVRLPFLYFPQQLCVWWELQWDYVLNGSSMWLWLSSCIICESDNDSPHFAISALDDLIDHGEGPLVPLEFSVFTTHHDHVSHLRVEDLSIFTVILALK